MRIYLFPILLLALAACEKDETDPHGLPPATQEGKNTAGWLLDGKAWVPKTSDFKPGSPARGYWRKTYSGHSLTVGFSQLTRNEEWGVAFFVPDIRQAGTFLLNQKPTFNKGPENAPFGEYHHLQPSPRLSYFTGPDGSGQLTITRFDTVNNIVSGTFEMTPREVNGGPTVNITQGRFDLHFDR